MIARMRRNQTGVEQKRINWDQIREAYLDYKTWLFTLLGFVSNIPNGGEYWHTRTDMQIG